MQIDLPADIEAIAEQKAAAIGASVTEYVYHLILGDEPDMPSDAELAASGASLDQAMEDVRAGRTLSVSDAKLRIERNFGLRPDS